MNTWTLAHGEASSDPAQAALLGMIAHVGSPAFTGAALAALNRSLPAGSWSVYQTSPEREPVCYLSDSFERRDTTPACFRAYQTGLYRGDRTFASLAPSPAPQALQAIHLAAGDVADRAHRQAIYERYQLRERLSVASALADGAILSVNLYRHADQDGFGERELQTFQQLAPGLFALVARQIALCPPAAARFGARRQSYRDTLLNLAPGMPERELDVCVRLLTGMSHDGIACDLGIGASTVKTYRNRAFERLAIHHNNELFALLLARRG